MNPGNILKQVVTAILKLRSRNYLLKYLRQKY